MADLERLFPAERDLTLLPNFLLDRPSFERCLNDPGGDRRELFDLAMQAHELSLLQTYDHLLCLSGLRGVQPLQYQEETVRKVLKDFRGRAILADEVGLGKTIEAGMVLKEYLLRRMIEHALILVPSSLVTQWREELNEKFGLVCSTSEDPEFRENPRSFWNRELIITSLHAAKSDLHLPLVTTRHFDLVIVDEAHHLKHNSTKNWKLVNALQKRYLLFLTATPVENNLLELYNLITLLKPGQLGTAAEFRAAFTTKGDLAQPRDSERLRGLLGTIMVRNTRAVVGVKLPPRIATTLRVPGTPEETARYEQVTTLVKATLAQGLKRMTAGTLLHEAGSSTAALRQGLRNLLAHGLGIVAHQPPLVDRVPGGGQQLGDGRAARVGLARAGVGDRQDRDTHRGRRRRAVLVVAHGCDYIGTPASAPSALRRGSLEPWRRRRGSGLGIGP